jgi:hypothetical protein
MRNQKELTDLFTEYFSDRLSPTEIDCLVTDVVRAAQYRRVRPEPRREMESCTADD